MADTSEPSTHNPLIASDVEWLQLAARELGLELLFYGVQAVLCVAAVRVLIRRHSRLLPATLIALFASSTLAVAANFLFYLVQFSLVLSVKAQTPKALLVRLDIMTVVADRFNYVLSDVIVVWRAWILWSDSRIAKSVLSLCVLGTLACTIIELVWFYAKPAPIGAEFPVLIPSIVRSVLLLVTNLAATSAIGLKFWIYRRDIKGALGLMGRKTQVERVLLLLLESGFVYCCLWTFYLAISSTAERASSPLTEIIGSSFHGFSGVYPAFIVLVAMHTPDGSSQSLLSTQISQAMRFTGQDAGQAGEKDVDGSSIDHRTEDEEEACSTQTSSQKHSNVEGVEDELRGSDDLGSLESNSNPDYRHASCVYHS